MSITDRMTSVASTFPYAVDTMQDMISVVRNAKLNGALECIL